MTSTGGTAQLLAVGTYSSGTPATQNLTDAGAWQSSDAFIATVRSTGLVTGVSLRSAIITAVATTSDGSILTGSSAITVQSGPSQRNLASLTVTPTTQTVASTGGTARLLAVGTYSSGSPATQDLTSDVS